MEALGIRAEILVYNRTCKGPGAGLGWVCALYLHPPILLGLGSFPKACDSVSKGMYPNLNHALVLEGTELWL